MGREVWGLCPKHIRSRYGWVFLHQLPKCCRSACLLDPLCNTDTTIVRGFARNYCIFSTTPLCSWSCSRWTMRIWSCFSICCYCRKSIIIFFLEGCWLAFWRYRSRKLLKFSLVMVRIRWGCCWRCRSWICVRLRLGIWKGVWFYKWYQGQVCLFIQKNWQCCFTCDISSHPRWPLLSPLLLDSVFLWYGSDWKRFREALIYRCLRLSNHPCDLCSSPCWR